MIFPLQQKANSPVSKDVSMLAEDFSKASVKPKQASVKPQKPSKRMTMPSAATAKQPQADRGQGKKLPIIIYQCLLSHSCVLIKTSIPLMLH